jgi:hypothetical protein
MPSGPMLPIEHIHSTQGALIFRLIGVWTWKVTQLLLPSVTTSATNLHFQHTALHCFKIIALICRVYIRWIHVLSVQCTPP